MAFLLALGVMLVVAGAIGTVTGYGMGATVFSLCILVGGGLAVLASIVWWVFADIFGDSSHTHRSSRNLEKARQGDAYSKSVIEETTYHSEH